MELAIFGAQGMALGLYEALHSLYPKRQVKYFIVSSKGINSDTFAGLPVLELPKLALELSAQEKEHIEILIATPENTHKDIEESLEGYGFKCIRTIDSKRWADFMKMYHARLGEFLPLSALPIGYHKPQVMAFAAKSHKDYTIDSNYGLPDWIHYVQAGTALCEQHIAELMDNQGENISDKNGNYSELTVLYWIWKNILNKSEVSEEYIVGLVQYRRILEFEKDDLLRLQDNDVDVVLPYPMPYEPDMNAHHERYLKEEDWKALLEALKELQPEYAEDFEKLLKQKYLYNYNIILAKKQVLKDYCEWLFPILNRVETLSIPKGSERADRYIGYMGETLETLYFMRNRDKLNIVHTGCRFLK